MPSSGLRRWVAGVLPALVFGSWPGLTSSPATRLGEPHCSSDAPCLSGGRPPVTVLEDGTVRVGDGGQVREFRQVRRRTADRGPAPAGPLPAGGEVYPGCLVCHGDLENATAAMGFDLDCTVCHGGDPEATEKAAAHVQPSLPVINDATVPPLDYDLPYQRFVNPSNLRVMDQACGLCHEAEVGTVRKSLMATAAGHHAGGLYQNNVVGTKTPLYGTFAVRDEDGEVPVEKGAVASLLDLVRYDPAGDPLKVSTHYAAVPGQACARCHLWSRGKGHRGALGAEGLYRADGCAACHVLYADHGLSESADTAISHAERGHPRMHAITRAIPTEQCRHCHHRGARIGLSFTGLSQMPPRLASGPGVPGTTSERFNGDYHFSDPATNPPDVHHQLGMHCIDCHTAAESMGDGNLYGHMDQATRIECESCHGRPGQAPTLEDNDGEPLPNLRIENGAVVLTSKVTGRQHRVPLAGEVVDPQSPHFNPRAARAMTPHHLKDQGGMECYACHSAWMPTCYGCHFERDERQQGLNLVTRELEPGKVRLDNRVFITFRRFALGPNSEGRLAPYVVGCQPIADVTAADGSKLLDFVMPVTANGLSGLALNPVQPHTVRGRGEVRGCAECHRAPSTLGLGSGSYNLARHRAFVASADGVRVYDHHTDPLLPRLEGTLAVDQARALACQPNLVRGTADWIFVASPTAGALVFDLRGAFPAAPASVIEVPAVDVAVAGQHLFVVVEGVGVEIHDISDPARPRQLAAVAIPTARRAVPWGIHLLVAAGPAGLVIADVRDPAAPVIAGSLPGIHAAAVRPYAHYQVGPGFAARAYVADPDYGVRVVDLTTAFDRPRLVGGLELPGALALDTGVRYRPATDATAAGEHDYLYVAAGLGGVRVYDITRPEAIVPAGGWESDGTDARDIDVCSHLAPPGVDERGFVADNTYGFRVLDLNDPSEPRLAGGTAGGAPTAVLVEVQAMDRFLDEQCRPLKENSHPFITPMAFPDLARILAVPDVAAFVDHVELAGLSIQGNRLRLTFHGEAAEASAYAVESAPGVLGPWREDARAVVVSRGGGSFEATLPSSAGAPRFIQVKRVR